MQPKEAARKYMHGRQEEKKPVPSTEEIRHQMGWNMIPENKDLPLFLKKQAH